jgi:sulfhydrogenase subunit beta (sulfur reductase)
MSQQQVIITHENLLKLLGEVVSSGKQLYAPQQNTGKTYFLPVRDVHSITFDYIQTTVSPKEFLFPKTERMLSYNRADGIVQVTDHAEGRQYPERVLFGSRPCDAAALKTLADFFRRDVPDAFIQKHQDSLVVISVSCIKSDENCFCTSVGTSPGGTDGSDILLTPIENANYCVEIITEKGKSFLTAYETCFEKSGPVSKENYLVKIEKEFSSHDITEYLSNAFDNPLWNDASLRCLGCGACAYVCPVCSCFDIQDEGTSTKGDRLRCWDSCGFSLFTLHTSGHNPRKTQSDRWRQRVMHKFSYMPERYELLGCVGCGRCSRACPADMNIKEQLEEITENRKS